MKIINVTIFALSENDLYFRKTRRQTSRYKLKEQDVRVNNNTTDLEREDEHAQPGHVSDVSEDIKSVNTPSKEHPHPKRQQN